MDVAAAPADSTTALSVNEQVLSSAAAMMLQAACRRLLVRARRARLIQAREVKRRTRRRNAVLSTEAFTIAGDQLKELQRHSFRAIEVSADQMPAVKRSIALKGVGCVAHRLLWAIEGLTRVAAASTEGAACDEMGLLLCEVLLAAQCEVFPVEAGSVDSQDIDFLRLNHRTFVPVAAHGLFGHDKCNYAAGKPVSFPHFEEKAAKDKANSVAVLEWYEARTGFREMLVKAAEQDKVQASMRERNLKTTRLPHRVKEYGHVMCIPVFAHSNRSRPRPGEATSSDTPGHASHASHGNRGGTPHERKSRQSRQRDSHGDDDDDYDAEPPLGSFMALVQLSRPAHEAPFDDNDEYLAQALAPHLGHALRRAQLLSHAQDQRRQLLKLHAFAGGKVATETPDDLCQLANSLFASDDVALYAMMPGDGGADRQRATARRGSKIEAETVAAAQALVRSHGAHGPRGGARGLGGAPAPAGAGKLHPVRRGASTPFDSVIGLEALCSSGQALAISQGEVTSKGFESILALLRRPAAASSRSMLCVPAYVHRQSLGLEGPSGDAGDAASVVPCLLQWSNSHGRPFNRSDLLVASALTDVLGRIASAKSLRGSQLQLEERFRVGDQRRNALMESARMLANRMGMEELFAAVMLHAKDLMDVDRSTLFMVDRVRQCMYTIVADGAEPITIPWGSGLAGAAYLTGKVVNVPDAYRDTRFNREIDIKNGYRTKSVLCYPIQNSRDEVIAVIQLINKANGLKFNALDEELVAAFCAQLAVSIENVLAIDEMHKAETVAKHQQRRMSKFLDVCGQMVQAGLPVHELCERMQSAAIECTDSTGAALFICADNAPDVLSAKRLDLDAIESSESFRRPTDAGGGGGGDGGGGGEAGGGGGEGDDDATAPAFAFPRRKKEEVVELDLHQVVPDPSVEAYEAVHRFCMTTLTTNATLEDAVDLNDNGLPEILKQYVESKLVRCLATPLSIAEGTPKPLGVLAVWGGDDYTLADHKVLHTLAVLASHLIIANDEKRAAELALDVRAERLRGLSEQRDALVHFARQLGTPTPEALHSVARSVAEPLACGCVTLWLIKTDASRAEQMLITELPPGTPVGDEEGDDEGGGGGGSGEPSADPDAAAHDRLYGSGPVIGTLDDGTRTVSVPVQGKSILAHVVATAQTMRIPDAHIHSAYSPEIDEAVYRLQPNEAALCLIPIVDHTGRVVGVLQASAKRRPVHAAGEPPPSLWERDQLDTPVFTLSDEQFLTLIADRMGTQLQQLAASGKSATEVTDQQQQLTNLHDEAGRLSSQIVEKRQLLHQIHPTLGKGAGAGASHLRQRGLGGGGVGGGGLGGGGLGGGSFGGGGLGGSSSSSSVLGFGAPADSVLGRRAPTPPSRGGSAASSGLGDAQRGGARLPALDAAPPQPQPLGGPGFGPGGGDLLKRGKRGATASQPNLLPRGSRTGPSGGRGGGRNEAGGLPVPRPGGGTTLLTTPEAVFDDLYRALREL